MVLHVALDGVDGVGKTTMAGKLKEFLTGKGYNVTTRIQPANEDIKYILSNYNLLNHEIALLMAFDRSFSYYGEKWDNYDLVIWDRSILSSYAYNTDKNTTSTYIKQINKYFPEMNLYIIIVTDDIIAEQDYTRQNKQTLIQNYNNLIQNYKGNIIPVTYEKDNPDKVFENIVKIIFDNLPRCNWCGRLFTPSKHYKKYCQDKCRKYSLEEQYRENNRTYYQRYKNVMSERQKGGLGSKGANLHGKADMNPLRELQKIRRGKKALGLPVDK